MRPALLTKIFKGRGDLGRKHQKVIGEMRKKKVGSLSSLRINESSRRHERSFQYWRKTHPLNGEESGRPGHKRGSWFKGQNGGGEEVGEGCGRGEGW